MKKRFKNASLAIAGLLCAILALLYLHSQIKGNPVALTADEQRWIAQHRNSIRYAPIPDAPPFDFIEDGRNKGLTPDYIHLVEKKLGMEFVIVPYSKQKKIIDDLKRGKIDLVGSLQATPDRRKHLRFTRPYYRIDNIILMLKESPGTYSLDGLQGFSIAIVNGSATYAHVAKRFPNYTLVPVENAESGFRKVAQGDADAMIIDRGVASYYVSQRGFSNLRVAGYVDYTWDLRLASTDTHPELRAILDKALDSISDYQRFSINRNWITLDEKNSIEPTTLILVIASLLLLTLLSVGTIMIWNRTLKKQVRHRTHELGHAQRNQQQTTRALDKSEERFRNLVETTSDWIWEVDIDGLFTYVSPQVNNLLGYTPAELVGKRFTEPMPHLEATAMETHFAEVVEQNAPIHSMLNVNRHKDGRTVVFETSAVPFYDKAGNIMGYRGIGRDITARKKSGEEVRRLRTQLSNIIDSMPSALMGVDTDGRVMQWNREAERMTGTPTKQALGQPLKEVFPDLGGEMARVLEAIENKQLQHDEHIPCVINGEPSFADVTVYPLTTDGDDGAVIRVDDVTNRVHIEEMMIQSEKMVSVGGLAAGMAHEINNPLAGILQNLHVMHNRITHNTDRNIAAAEGAGTSLEAIQAYMQDRGLLKMMDSAREAGERAAKIVDNMLSFSRKDGAHFEPNNLADLLERSIELASNDYNLKKRFDFRHIRIEREYEDVLERVPCEAGQIQQVILNLLANCAQAIAEAPDNPEKPRITLRLKRETNMALIEVEDNGPGMDAETRKRAFEPFFTTKEVGRGTGLGLSVSYFIITENHGGTMGIHSEPGKGTCFSIRIPPKQQQTMRGHRL